MNYFFVYVLMFLSLLYLSGCINKQGANINATSVINYKLTDLNKVSTVKLSDLGVNDIEYIPLETTSKSIISEIYKLRVNDRFIIIQANSKLLEFSNTGSFVTQIGREGKGAGEYQFCKDFSVDNNHRVYILSMHENKIYIYSPEGKFVRTIPCPKTSTKLCCLENDILCFSENVDGLVENSFDVIDYEGKTLKSFPNKFNFEVGKFKGLLLNECASFLSEGQLYIKEVSSDTVFVYRNLDLMPVFILDSGGKSIPPGERHINSFEEFMKITLEYISVRRLLKFGEYIYYGFMLGHDGYMFIGSVNSGHNFLGDLRKGIINDLDGGPNIWFKVTKNDNTIISWINAFELKAHVASDSFRNSKPKYPEKKKELERLAKSLTENDNPVLMLVKLEE